MRACTACVVEVSFEPTKGLYKGVVEFMKPEQWQETLE